MPIDVLTREDIEKIVEGKLKKLPSDKRIQEKIAELKSSTSKLTEDVSRLATREVQVPGAHPLVTALAKDLGPLADMLEIQDTKDSVSVEPSREPRSSNENPSPWQDGRRLFCDQAHSSRSLGLR